MFSVKIPKILFLALDIASFYRRSYINTNDLSKYANQYKRDLVRLRADKSDYKYLDDTFSGGLRGNFSTLLTLQGLVKRGSLVTKYYSVGRDNRLINAICNGEIILNKKDFSANTNNNSLKKLLEIESCLLTVMETQAHIKVFLEEHPLIPLKRDAVYFPKESAVVSDKGQFYIRALVNNFIDPKNRILEYNLIHLWEGKKIHKKNFHVLVVIPARNDPWGQIFAIKNEDLWVHKPIFIQIDLKLNICSDRNGNMIKLYPLNEALKGFSAGDSNIEHRLGYDWNEIKMRESKGEISGKVEKEEEFSVFLRLFLGWRKEFSIGGKRVVDIFVSSSGGPDVILKFSGGTSQKLELEHTWKSYIDHGHYKDNAWAHSWIFSEEEFSPKLIIKLYGELKKKHHNRIPDVFLCVSNGKGKAYLANWGKEQFEEIPLKF